MKPTEVIEQDSEKRGINPKAVLFGVHHFIKQGGLLLSDENTVLVLQRISKNAFASHLFTTDAPLGLSKSLLKFFRQMQNKGIHRLYGKADNKEIINLLKQLGQREGVEVLPSDLPRYNWMMDL
jgi:hypothetical protein